MHSVAPFVVATPPALAWRLSAGLVCVAAAACLVPWLAAWARVDAAPALAVAAGALAVVGCGLGVCGGRGPALHWAGPGWRLGDASSGVDGAVDLCLDLGGFVLLRFVPAGARAPWRATWLPLAARRDEPMAWHTLRCALYAAAEAPAAVRLAHG